MVTTTPKRLAACLIAAFTLIAPPALAEGDRARDAARSLLQGLLHAQEVRSQSRSNQGSPFNRNTSNWGSSGSEIILYDDVNFRGGQVTLDRFNDSLGTVNFNDRASSIVVRSGRWQVCANSRYLGQCQVIDSNVSNLSVIGLNNRITSIRPLDSGYSGRRSELVLYQDPEFRGRRVVLDAFNDSIGDIRFNDIASSAEVFGGTWEICADSHYGGRCERISGRVRFLSSIGLNDRITSARPIGDGYSNRAYQNDDYYRNEDWGQRNGGYDTGLLDDWLFGGRSDSSGFAVVFTRPDCQGRSLNVSQPISRLRDFGFNNVISSIDIREGAFEVCSDNDFRGRCRIVSRDIGSLRDIGLDDSISSIRPVYEHAYYDDSGRRQYPY